MFGTLPTISRQQQHTHTHREHGFARKFLRGWGKVVPGGLRSTPMENLLDFLLQRHTQKPNWIMGHKKLVGANKKELEIPEGGTKIDGSQVENSEPWYHCQKKKRGGITWNRWNRKVELHIYDGTVLLRVFDGWDMNLQTRTNLPQPVRNQKSVDSGKETWRT